MQGNIEVHFSKTRTKKNGINISINADTKIFLTYGNFSYLNKGRSRITMVWVPRSDLIHIARVSGSHYKINSPQVSTRKNFFYKSYERILKNQKISFSRKRLNRS